MSYFAMLTHDLKSPTRAQINALNLLMKGYFGKLTPKQYEVIKLTCTSSKYMSDIVSSILAGYKCTSCPMTMNKSEFDIISLVNDVMQRYKFMAAEKNLKIIFNHRDDSYVVSGDKLQIERVIANLISNSIIYSLSGTEIIINMSSSDMIFDLSVSNHSYPIGDDEMKNIFNRFTKTKTSAMNTKSTGLGLYTAKKIIDNHNGEIYAKSSPDGNCVFGFILHAKGEPVRLLRR